MAPKILLQCFRTLEVQRSKVLPSKTSSSVLRYVGKRRPFRTTVTKHQTPSRRKRNSGFRYFNFNAPKIPLQCFRSIGIKTSSSVFRYVIKRHPLGTPVNKHHPPILFVLVKVLKECHSCARIEKRKICMKGKQRENKPPRNIPKFCAIILSRLMHRRHLIYASWIDELINTLIS